MFTFAEVKTKTAKRKNEDDTVTVVHRRNGGHRGDGPSVPSGSPHPRDLKTIAGSSVQRRFIVLVGVVH